MTENVPNPFEEVPVKSDTIHSPKPLFDVNEEEVTNMSDAELLHNVNLLEDEIQKLSVELSEKEAELSEKYNPESSFFLKMGGSEIVAKLQSEDMQPFRERMKILKDEQSMFLKQLKLREKDVSRYGTDAFDDLGDDDAEPTQNAA